MTSSAEGKIAITALIALAGWIFVCLPILYLPGEPAAAHGEFLGVKYGEWLIFLATMALVWATWRLVKGADATAERQLRAYVFVQPLRTDFLYEGTTCRFTVTYAVRNSGKTPAHELIQFGELRNIMVPTATTISTPAPDGLLSVMSLGPGDQIEGTVWGITDISTLKTLGTSFRKPHTVGAVYYRDAFGHLRQTEFCFYVSNLGELIEGHIGASGNDGKPIFFFTAQHNSAT